MRQRVLTSEKLEHIARKILTAWCAMGDVQDEAFQSEFKEKLDTLEEYGKYLKLVAIYDTQEEVKPQVMRRMFRCWMILDEALYPLSKMAISSGSKSNDFTILHVDDAIYAILNKD